MMISKDLCWERLVDHFYDHVYWEETPAITIYQWLARDYRAVSSIDTNHIQFADPADQLWFTLKWL